MPVKKRQQLPSDLIAEWPLPPAATLGSSVRAKGILQEIQAGLPFKVRSFLDIAAGTLILRMPDDREDVFHQTRSVVASKLDGIEHLPVIPREIEDILAISTTERHRWLKDGRLPSAGTRTVKLRGRAKKITFHVLDPRVVEDILDEDRVASWREDDAITAAENRRKAAWKAKLKRAEKKGGTPPADGERPQLLGWDAFEREGLLR